MIEKPKRATHAERLLSGALMPTEYAREVVPFLYLDENRDFLDRQRWLMRLTLVLTSTCAMTFAIYVCVASVKATHAPTAAQVAVFAWAVAITAALFRPTRHLFEPLSRAWRSRDRSQRLVRRGDIQRFRPYQEHLDDVWFTLHRRDSDIDIDTVSRVLHSTYKVLQGVGLRDVRVAVVRRAPIGMYVSYYEGPPDPLLKAGARLRDGSFEDLRRRRSFSTFSVGCSLGGTNSELLVLATSVFTPIDQAMLEAVAAALSTAFSLSQHARDEAQAISADHFG